jgi:cytosine/adenosine deaminase-related metal-dependent hydrolase
MELPKNAHRYLYMLEAGALARDPDERDRLAADWTPDEQRLVAEECREKARLYTEEADRLQRPTVST